MTSFRSILRGNVLTLIWTRMLLFFSLRSYSSYFSLYILALGGSPQEIGLVTSMGAVTALVVVPIAGYLADTRGRVRVVASAHFFRSITYLIYMLSRNWVWLAIGTFYDGLTQYNHAALSAVIADSVPPDRRAAGFAATNTLHEIVSMIGPIFGAYVISISGIDLGMRYLFAIATVSMWVIGIGRLKFLTETLPTARSSSPPRQSVLAIIKASYKSVWETIRWTPKGLVGFVSIEVLSTFAGAMVGPFWVVYAQDIIHLTIPEWSLILFAEGLVRLFLSIPAGMVADKVGNRKIILLMLFLSLFPGVLFTFLCTTFQQALAVMLFLTTVIAFMSPATAAFMANMVPRELRARVSSAYGRGMIGVRRGASGAVAGYVMTAPSWLGSIVGGFLYTRNPSYPWLIQMGVLSVCWVVGVLSLKEPKTREV